MRPEDLIFFFKRLGLIAWLREFMSQRNPSRRSASSLNVEEITLLFSHVGRPGKAFLDHVGI